MNWTVVLTASAQRDLRRLDRPMASRILNALTRLADTGQGDVTRLQGVADDWYRAPFREDLRGLRNRITHFSYVKALEGLN